MSSAAKRSAALAILILCAVGTGISFVLGKLSIIVQQPLNGSESTWFLAAGNLAPRFVVGLALLMCVEGRHTLRLTRSEWGQAAFMAACSFVGCLIQMDGLQRTSAATTAFLTQFYVALMPVVGGFLHRRWPSRTALVSVVLVMAGVAVLTEISWKNFHLGRGECEVLAATFFFAILLCSVSAPMFAHNRHARTSAGMFLLEFLLFALVAAFTCDRASSLWAPYRSMSWIVLIVIISIIGTAGPFILINQWQRYVTEIEAGLIYSTIPLVAAVTEAFFPMMLAGWFALDYPNRPLTLAVGLGGALIFAANILQQLQSKPRGR